jgi:predicted nucleotide-binding protein
MDGADILRRFEDIDDRIAAVLRQRVVNGDESVARALVEVGQLRVFEAGETLIVQESYDRTAFFLLAGKVGMTINGCVFPYGRAGGDLIGEMSAINPELPRTATIHALEPVAALVVDHRDLIAIGEASRDLWRLMAVELTRRLEQRNRFVDATNAEPRIFMISSTEGLPIAEEIRAMLAGQGFTDTVLWSDDEVFPPGAYPLENLKREVALADFGIALAHPDDIRRSRGREAAVPRDNVVFELGWFMSVLDRHRTILLVPEPIDLELPSDFKGLTPLSYSEPNDRVPAQTSLAPVVHKLAKHFARWKVRSKLEPGS